MALVLDVLDFVLVVAFVLALDLVLERIVRRTPGAPGRAPDPE